MTFKHPRYKTRQAYDRMRASGHKMWAATCKERAKRAGRKAAMKSKAPVTLPKLSILEEREE